VCPATATFGKQIPREAFMFGISPLQLAVVLLVILLLFGNRLPMLARSLGASLIEFKKGVKQSDDTPAVHESNK
jgi:sec-independent protein translocase protein TatA